MKEDDRYDLIIVGGGAGGFAAANTANSLGKKTLMINDSSLLPLGGTCVNVGCVPSKIMLHQGEEYYYSVNSKFKAINVEGDADFVEALKETRDMVKGFRSGNYEKVVEKQELIDFVEGRAIFVDEHTVEVGGETYETHYFLIATGAQTFVPSIGGIEDIDYITNQNVFELEKKPESVIIIGAGPQGMEFSQIFRHFGVEVTVLQRSERVLTGFDLLIARELQKFLEEEGIRIYLNTEATEVREKSGKIEVVAEVEGKEKVFAADELFLATGLNPNTDDLQADRAGVELDRKGFVKTNKYMKTNTDNIYAAGDVTGKMPLETTSAKQGSIAVKNIFEDAKATIDYKAVPYVVFTNPQVAAVGITEEKYIEEHGICLCSTVTMDHVEKAQAIKQTRGMIRMVVNHETKEVVGVHIVGPIAADIITTAAYAIKNNMTIYDIRDTVHVFPTLSEMIKKAAQAFDMDLENMACCVE